MKSYRTYINESYSYSSVQVKMPDDISKKMISIGKTIPDDQLTSDGRDERPHITVKYGILSPNMKFLSDIKLPKTIKATMRKTSLFRNDDADVLKVDIESKDLADLNKLIVSSTKTTQTQGKYHAHATIAYLKPGTGDKYVGMDNFDGTEIVFDSIEFSSKDDDDYINIPLQ